MKLYCVEYKGIIGFFKPFNAVRDGETYSLTYIPTSVLDGIAQENHLSNKIARHKLTFYGMTDCDYVGSKIFTETKKHPMPQIRHSLKDVTLILGFERKEDAEAISKNTIYAGQREYMLFPSRKFEIMDTDFDELNGVETFESDESGIFCGFNRQRNNEKMYIKITRKEWK